MEWSGLIKWVNSWRTTYFIKSFGTYKRLVLKVKILSDDGDKVNINLPVPLIMAFVKSGTNMPNIGFGDQLQGIDFSMIISLVEQGVVGQLVEIESADGSTVRISVE